MFVLLFNLCSLIGAGIASAFALAFEWGAWRGSARLEWATMATGGIALLIAAGRRWRGLRWVWLCVNGIAVVLSFYALFQKDQQLVGAVGFDALTWIACLAIPVPMFVLVKFFKRIDDSFRWTRDPAVLGPE